MEGVEVAHRGRAEVLELVVLCGGGISCCGGCGVWVCCC